MSKGKIKIKKKIPLIQQMSFDMKDLKKELYDAALITAGATAVGLLARKGAGTPLGTPESLKGALKLVVAVGVGSVAVKYFQTKKWVPTDITG